MSSRRASFDLAQSRDYWRRLVPELSIDDDADPGAPLASGDPAALLATVRREGYLKIDRLLPADDAALLASAVVRVSAAGWLPPFCFVYDECWRVFCRIAPLLRTVLGDGYLAMPALWAWHVPPSDGAAGWRPHRDSPRRDALRADLTPTAATVWIALTDATPLNGCIHLVPAFRYADYRDPAEQMRFATHDVRAVPAAAGSVLLWSQNLPHWGGRSSDRAEGPRISLSVEFQAGDVAPFQRPLLELARPPSFAMRLWLIGLMIGKYTHMYGFAQDLVSLGELLAARPPARRA